MREQAKLLKEIRNKRKVSQAQVAELLGVNKQLISNIERGVCPIPAKHVDLISKTYKIPRKIFINSYLEDQEIQYKKGM